MKNFKIKNKILLALLVLLLAMTGGSAFLMYEMREINHQASVIAKEWLPRIMHSSHMALDLSSYRRVQYAFLLSTPDRHEHYINRMGRFAKQLEENAKKFEEVLDNEAEWQQYTGFSKNWESYLALSQRVFDLKRQGFDDAANQLVMIDGVKVYEDATSIIGEIVTENEERAQKSDEAAQAFYERAIVLSIALCIAIAIFALFTVQLLVSAIAKPINGITDYMDYLASGKLDKDVPYNGQKDEIGAMAHSVQVFKSNMVKTKEMEAVEEAEREAKEIRQKKINDATTRFEASMSEIVKFVATASSELQAAAQSLSSTAEETTNKSNTVAAASQEASANVQTVASATEELSASINEISSQVSRSSQVANRAVTDAEEAGKSVAELVEAAQKIGDVTKIISDIAEQTNLLALNATIEAARAGEAGKGFSVVAAEVKNLANESTKATEEIAAQISNIQTISQSSAQAIETICRIIREIDEISTAISASIQEQTSATQEITRNVTEAYTGTTEVDKNILTVSHAAQDTGSAASQVLSAADELARQATNLQQQFDMFREDIKAA